MKSLKLNNKNKPKRVLANRRLNKQARKLAFIPEPPITPLFKFPGKEQHGHMVGSYPSPTYQTWSRIIQKVTNPNHPEYKSWGGAGISMTPRWLEFKNFLNDVGVRPDGYVLSLKDREAGFNPDNCFWGPRQANPMISKKQAMFKAKIDFFISKGINPVPAKALGYYAYYKKWWDLEIPVQWFFFNEFDKLSPLESKLAIECKFPTMPSLSPASMFRLAHILKKQKIKSIPKLDTRTRDVLTLCQTLTYQKDANKKTKPPRRSYLTNSRTQA